MPGIDLRAPLRQEIKQRVLRVAVLHAHRRFDLFQGGGNLVLERLGELLPSLKIDRAELGGDGEAGGDGQPELGHLGQVGPLAAERFFIAGIAFGPVGPK